MQDQKQKIVPNFSIERKYGNLIVAGIDEAGRGPLAGPVVAACVILNQKLILNNINDSKKLSTKVRKEAFIAIKNNSYFGVGIISEKIIDQINILQATKLAMQNAYLNLCQKYNIFPQVVLFDGNFRAFNAELDQSRALKTTEAIIKGDSKSLSIAAASIIAKETRDQIMEKLHQEFPDYEWCKNQAYPTKFHTNKIKEIGICKYHRLTFEPIKSMIKINESN
jgi:ribonuclease HII